MKFITDRKVCTQSANWEGNLMKWIICLSPWRLRLGWVAWECIDSTEIYLHKISWGGRILQWSRIITPRSLVLSLKRRRRRQRHWYWSERCIIKAEDHLRWAWWQRTLDPEGRETWLGPTLNTLREWRKKTHEGWRESPNIPLSPWKRRERE